MATHTNYTVLTRSQLKQCVSRSRSFSGATTSHRVGAPLRLPRGGSKFSDTFRTQPLRSSRSRSAVHSRTISRSVTSATSLRDSDVAVLAIDVGTTGLKACVINQAGEVLGKGSSRYGRATQVGPRGEVEQDPADWLRALAAAARQALAAGGQVAAVVLSGQMQDLIPVRGGRHTRAALLYSDTRAQAEYEHMLATIGEARLKAEATNVKGAASVLAKWQWLGRHEPAVLEAAEHILLGAHSYVAYFLSDGAAVCTDRTTASTTGLLAPSSQWDAPEGGGGGPYCSSVLRELGLREALLPALADPWAPAGRVAPGRARQLALEELAGLPVFHGAGDLACTAVGTGAADHMYVGTSGWLAGVRPRTDEAPEGAGDPPGVFTVLHPQSGQVIRAASMVTAGGAVEWVRDLLWSGSATALAEVDAAAAEVAVGCHGLMFLPHLNGERSPFTDPSARGAFVGLSGGSGRVEMSRAVLEGVAFNFRTMAAVLDPPPLARPEDPEAAAPEVPATSAAPLALVGGGAKSALWSGMFADNLNRPMRRLGSSDEVAARGCASFALQGLGVWGKSEAPPEFFNNSALSGDSIVMPNAEQQASYDKVYPVWVKQFPALKDAGAFG